VNKRALESLIQCGALDSTGASRKGMLAALDAALGSGAKRQEDLFFGQESMFEVEHPPISPQEYEKNELLRMEKESLGLYVSEHPLAGVRDELRRKTDCALLDVPARREGEIVTVGGIVGALKQLTTRKGDPMVFVRLDDLSGSAEVVVFNSVYVAARELLAADAILVIKGRVDHKQEGETKLIAMEVTAFEAAQAAKEVRLRVDARLAPAGLIGELKVILEGFPGETPVFVDVDTSLGPKLLELPSHRVRPTPAFFGEVKALLGEAAVG
jgi:DNA polymerase III subunit alpha